MSGPAWVAFLVAAAIGAPARFVVDRAVERRTGGHFPWGTLVVNVTGCLGLGVLTGLGRYHGLDATTATVVGTGGFGAFTTFSTFTYETVSLAEQGSLQLAARNAVLGMTTGLAAAALGLSLTTIV